MYAADNDIQIRLNQEIQQQQIQKEQNLQQQQKLDNQVLPSMIINGEKIEVSQNVEEVGRALYISVMQKQWQAASIYLNAYLKFKNYDKSLAYFAQASLARIQNQPKIAEQKFKQALELQPKNAIIKLELARLLTEQQKNKEAIQLFQQVKDQISTTNNTVSKNIDKTVNSYLNGIQQRDNWQGSIAFGSRYATNINNSAEYYNNVIYYAADTNGDYILDEDGNKIPVIDITQKSPDPIDTVGIDYEATLTKRWSLSGRHGIALKGLAYGQIYNEAPDYNEITTNISAGYSFQTPRHQIYIAPVYENKYFAHDALYNAWGAKAEWMHFIGKDKALKLETELKQFNYLNYTTQNGLEYSTIATFWKILPKQWTIFGGFDFTDHDTKEKYLGAYQQQGVRLGLSKQFKAGFNATLFTSIRWRQFDKFTPIFNARRHDFEQGYTFVLQMPKFEFYGLTPNLTYRYNHNKSNVDWLYSYDKHMLSLKLEHRF
ncbi:MAG: porin family protein [Acinetobacter sp.]